MAGPDDKRYAIVANWLMQGWNLEGEGQGGKNGYLPYIKTDEIPYLLVLVLPEASPDASIGERLQKSVFLQDQAPDRGFKRIGGLQFSYQDFNSFAYVAKTYVERLGSE
ncbi:hypothetical protein CVT25_007597 [Psilocybe cyanescens]|uniref:Uncharacterized protein n=1 Tax=Psilocybe cyanescens TaxID=93625 RepID=A0A409VQ39_PSICY|nr:hypothetical protein CVT25_007597 [Psilocybe cyanescens]